MNPKTIVRKINQHQTLIMTGTIVGLSAVVVTQRYDIKLQHGKFNAVCWALKELDLIEPVVECLRNNTK